MTRINVVPVQELHDKHLLGEYKEITRVYTLARKAQDSGRMKSLVIPKDYTLGTGHVTFFYKRLGYISKRYQQLIAEMRERGFNPNPIPLISLEEGIKQSYFQDYDPSPESLRINRERIAERLAAMGIAPEGSV